MTYHISSDPSAPSQDTWILLHKYKNYDEPGLNITLHPSEEIACKAAVNIIVEYLDGYGWDSRVARDIASYINNQEWKQAIRVFNNTMSDSLTVEKGNFISEVAKIETIFLDEGLE